MKKVYGMIWLLFVAMSSFASAPGGDVGDDEPMVNQVITLPAQVALQVWFFLQTQEKNFAICSIWVAGYNNYLVGVKDFAGHPTTIPVTVTECFLPGGESKYSIKTSLPAYEYLLNYLEYDAERDFLYQIGNHPDAEAAFDVGGNLIAIVYEPLQGGVPVEEDSDLSDED